MNTLALNIVKGTNWLPLSLLSISSNTSKFIVSFPCSIVDQPGTSLLIAGRMSKNGILPHRLQTVPAGIEIAIELQHFIPDNLELSMICLFRGDGLQIQMMIMRGFH
jgi:hypothetical protein